MQRKEVKMMTMMTLQNQILQFQIKMKLLQLITLLLLHPLLIPTLPLILHLIALLTPAHPLPPLPLLPLLLLPPPLPPPLALLLVPMILFFPMVLVSLNSVPKLLILVMDVGFTNISQMMSPQDNIDHQKYWLVIH